LALGTTAVALLIAGVALSAIRLHKHSVEKEIQQWQAVSEWQAPTDALLNAQDAPR
jgi:biopolymer transport protein ExbB/TolQ